MSGSTVLPGMAWGFASAGTLMLVLLVPLLLRLAPIFDAPVPLDLWNAPPWAQAQIAAAWVLSSVAVTVIGWVVVAIYLPLAIDVARYDVTVLSDAKAVLPGLCGLLLGMLIHARLLVWFLILATRCGLCAAAAHLDRFADAPRKA